MLHSLKFTIVIVESRIHGRRVTCPPAVGNIIFAQKDSSRARLYIIITSAWYLNPRFPHRRSTGRRTTREPATAEPTNYIDLCTYTSGIGNSKSLERQFIELLNLVGQSKKPKNKKDRSNLQCPFVDIDRYI